MTMMTSTNTAEEDNSSSLILLNYANAIIFFINLVIVFGSQSPYARGMKDNATLSKKYQTLVTPKGYAFSIWGIIFIAEMVFVVTQFIPFYSNPHFVKDIVGYNFILACIAQSLWSVCFGYEMILASMVCMIGILVPLCAIVFHIFNPSLDTTATVIGVSRGSFSSWLCNEFPIEIHCGWIMAATLVNLNLLLVSYQVSSMVQIVAAYTTLATILLVGIYSCFMIFVIVGDGSAGGSDGSAARPVSAVFDDHQPSYVIPFVLVWASMAISKELEHPIESIAANFSPDTIKVIKVASKSIGYLILICAGIRFSLHWLICIISNTC
mmetsp:Transcript_16154/g.18108  ORF Transcript_16154/g.18108 Transcript_16154/m.18108 type:complete len:324 (+) Transcript_16154:144-1115(+)